MLTFVDSESGSAVGGIPLEVLRAGEGAPLLLLHGVEGVPADAEFVSALAGDFSVIAPSHPGFGLSPRPNWVDSVEDLAYLYLQWLRDEDLQDVTIVGLQFGGWVAAEMAVRDTSSISRLVLVDPVGIKPGGREDRDIADIFAMPRTELDARLYADSARGPGDLTQAEEEVVLRLARNEEALAVYGWEPFLHNPHLQRWLHRIDVPTTVVWGDQDGIVSRGYAEAFASAIPGSQFAVVDGAGHCAQIDRPAQVADIVRFAG